MGLCPLKRRWMAMIVVNEGWKEATHLCFEKRKYYSEI